MRMSSIKLSHSSTALLAIAVAVAACPGVTDAQQRSHAQVERSRHETLQRRTAEALQRAQQELSTLVETTRPVVRLPEALVEELAEIEREVFEAQIQLRSLENQIKMIAESLKVARESGLSDEKRMQVERANLEIEEVEASLTAAKANASRHEKLAEDGIVPQSELQQAQLQLQLQQSRLRRAKANREAIEAASNQMLALRSEKLAERTRELKEFRMTIDIREQRASDLRAIFDKCFEYQRLLRSEIPSLETDLVEFEANLRRLPQARQNANNADSADDPAAIAKPPEKLNSDNADSQE